MNGGHREFPYGFRAGLRWGLLGLGLIAAALSAHAATFTVTNTADAGIDSLRDAIERSNLTPQTADTIAFNIPGAGPHTIRPLTPLPTITSRVTIDGYTQPGARRNTDASSSNAVLKIVLDGSAKISAGLVIAAGGSRVTGLVINAFRLEGVRVAGTGSIVIEGNFIGTDAAGLAARGNGSGIRMDADSSGTSIGGTSPGQRNVISGNQFGAISSHRGSGLTIVGNLIGTNAAGTGALGNGGDGIILADEHDAVVGGINAGAGNVIANSRLAGVAVVHSGSIGNSIRGNQIFNNGQLGIDLFVESNVVSPSLWASKARGVTANDGTPDADKGANRLQNFPILTSVETSGAGIAVKGTLTSMPNTTFHLDFYGNEQRDPSGHGEGQFYLGTMDVTTDGKGEADFRATLPASPGPFISATATNAGNFAKDTSEFSPLVARAGKEFGVNTTDPAGPGSLDQAVADSNAAADPSAVNRIYFNIPGTGPHVIRPVAGMPIKQAVTIAAPPLIRVDGLAMTHGEPIFSFEGNNSTLRGVSIVNHRPPGPTGAVQVTGNGNWLSGVWLGVDPDDSPGPNTIGITVFGQDNLIGGPDPSDANIISANGDAGVALGPGAFGNLIQGNLIGTDSTGTQNRGNGDTGVFVVADAQQNRIVDNRIAYNNKYGVFFGGTGAGNTVSRNSMYANGNSMDLAPPLGSDTNDFGDADDRANAGQNFPDLKSATIVGSVTVAGTINSTPDAGFLLEFFVSPACSPTGFGEGRTFLGETTVITDAVGDAAYSATLPDTVAAGQVITATATDVFGSTSEFSRCIPVANGPPPPGTVVGLLSPKEANSTLGNSHAVTATLTSGGAPLANVPVDFAVVSGPNSDQGGTVATDGNGKATFSYTSDGTPGTDAILATGVATGVQFSASAAMTWGASASTTVIEYYNAALDHYFITWVPAEIAILDAGTQIKGWVRTGHTFMTYTAAQAGTSPVCRYYIPPGLGDSHFFGRGTAECNATGQQNPTFVLEDALFMHMFLPNLGVCPGGTTPIHRVFSNRPDANHRYMIDPAVRDQMVALGWLVEGDGPDLIVMCAPP